MYNFALPERTVASWGLDYLSSSRTLIRAFKCRGGLIIWPFRPKFTNERETGLDYLSSSRTPTRAFK